MQRLEVSCAVRRIYKSLGAEGLTKYLPETHDPWTQLFLAFQPVFNTKMLEGV